jgi:hypothetical protein
MYCLRQDDFRSSDTLREWMIRKQRNVLPVRHFPLSRKKWQAPPSRIRLQGPLEKLLWVFRRNSTLESYFTPQHE